MLFWIVFGIPVAMKQLPISSPFLKNKKKNSRSTMFYLLNQFASVSTGDSLLQNLPGDSEVNALYL